MPTDVKMPQMGESIAEGTLTRWFKKPGDAVKRDEPLFEISTDKVDAEVPAPADGVLEEILVAEGTTVEVNTTVARLGDGSGARGGNGAAPAKAAASPGAPPKASAPASAPPKPAPAPAPAAAERVAPKSAPAERPAAHAAAPAAVARAPSAAAADPDRAKVRSSPLVRRIARENGVEDLSMVPGTGAGGRITKDDILGFLDTRNGSPERAPAAAPGAPPTRAATPSAHGDVLPVLGLPRKNATVERMTVMRRKIAEHMVHSRRVSAHVHSVFEADMTRVVAIRVRWKGAFEAQHGVKLTYTPFFMKACVDAIREFPWVNASLDGDEIIVHRSVNFGIAVALDGGLIVPVVRGAEELNVTGLQKRVTDLATRARSKQLLPDEVQGGTFTITNPGQYGGLFGIPIISQPQVAILGVGGIQRRPVVVEGDAIAIRDMAYLCLSYDHRLVDGALADRFMSRVKQNLETCDDAEFR